MLPQLQEGDMVNVVSIVDGNVLVTHVGLIVLGPGGERRFLNSAEPAVREESFDAFFARTAEREARNGKRGRKLAYFKVLRLNDNVIVPCDGAATAPRRTKPQKLSAYHTARLFSPDNALGQADAAAVDQSGDQRDVVLIGGVVAAARLPFGRRHLQAPGRRHHGVGIARQVGRGTPHGV
ncbi:hypothetical protein LP420_03080 [Massilia sp. B-10]|nr:hypothetical protein LP420_03080 [Massilia sp. B-10]